MSPGSEHSAVTSLPSGSLWPSSSSGSRPPASSSNINHPQLDVNTTTPPRSTSLPFTAMGQSFSKSHTATLSPAGPPPSPSTAQRGLTAAMAGGLRLKRAFANRRKKSEDASKMMDRSISGDEASASAQDYHHRQQRIQATASSSSSPAQVMPSPSTSSHDARHLLGAKHHLTQLATQVFHVGSPHKSSRSPLQQQVPPPTPPKPTSVPSPPPQPQTPPRPPPLKATSNLRASVIPMSPSISSAVNYMRMGEEERNNEKTQATKVGDNGAEVKAEAKEKEKELETTDGDKGDAIDKGEMKDSWRKSDSTISHHTIRPGSRPSRPVSMAESLQSNHTIVAVSKRQSALITDADFGMPEEDDSDSNNHHDGTTANDLSRTSTTSSNTFPAADADPSPIASIKARDRRSMSLNITTNTAFAKHKLPPTPSSASAANLTHSVSEHSQYVAPPAMSPSHSRDAPPSLRTPTNVSGYIAPSSQGGGQSTGTNIRGRLAAWTATTAQSQSQSQPPFPSQHQQQPRSTSNNPYTTFPPPPEPAPSSKPLSRLERSLPALPQQPRQPTISMTGGLGLAKRAVEKMGLGRAWGMGSGSSATSTSGYSSSSSGHSYSNYTGGTPPSSYGVSGQHMHAKHGHGHSGSGGSGQDELVRTSSGQSQGASSGVQGLLHKKHRLRHTPNAPSMSSTASASTSASASASDSDAMAYEAPVGPSLGKRLRGPMRKSGGGGVLFGRELRSVVRDTGVGVGKPRGWGGRWRNWDGEEEGEVGRGEGGGEGGGERTRKGSVRRGQLKALEERKLPALVVRCAQHLLIWGVQEEGLFRVSGRPSHVSKLRTEFDSGADFDMTECSPGDLDPHAVASVFKAFLRELPEPILTNALLPYFDAAMTQESTANASKDAEKDTTAPARKSSQGPGLPSGPRNSNGLPAMRKPPSLSTLAMPTFSGLRPPSKSLLSAFQALLAQLPEENRDLIRTVAELIRATARESKETKMPLSNLLLVFCPSLNMNPPLLRVLCEAEGIWEEPVREGDVLDIRKSVATTEEGEEFEDARDGMEDEGERGSLRSGSVSVGRTSEDVPSSVEYHAETEDLLGRAPYQDAGDDASSMSMSMSQSARRDVHVRKASLAASSVMDDGSSFLSTSEDQDNPSRHYSDVHSQSISPPLLTSSAESLDTPATSSHHPSLPHLPVEDGYKVPQRRSASSPVIAEPSPTGLSPITARRPVISSPVLITEPVQFPSTAADSQLPYPTKLEKRRSIPILSLPNLSPSNSSIFSGPDSPTWSLASRAKRLKKPSLHLLFSKKSTSSLSSPRVGSPSLRPVISSPYLQAPHSASDSSISTPLSAVTAPQSSTHTLPPKLDTEIENSSLRFGLGLGIEITETPVTPDTAKQETQAKTSIGSRPLPIPPMSPPQLPAVTESAVDPIPRGPTPIADRYHRSASPSPSLALSSKSQLSLVTPQEHETPTVSHLRPNPTSRSRGLSTASNASSNHLGLLDDDEQEDWTQSVLLAADVDGGWVVEQPAAQG